MSGIAKPFRHVAGRDAVAGRSAPRIVGLVADDLTGAGDSAVHFARAGWRARLMLRECSRPADDGTVVAMISDARAMPERAARLRTEQTVRALRELGTDALFVKIDSTMRGSVRAQVAGALRAWRESFHDAFAVVCPAYPAMGRTLVDGRVLVDGVDVGHTAMGRDPVAPIACGDMAALLPGSALLSLSGAGSAADAAQLAAAAARGVVVVNAETDADLITLSAALRELGPRAVPVGSAGLAAALASQWPREIRDDAGGLGPVGGGQVVLVSGSLHSVSRSQIDHLIEHLPPGAVGVRGVGVDRAPSAVDHDGGADLPVLVITTAADDRGPHHRPYDPGSASETAALLAAAAGDQLATSRIAALVLVGGDGARAVLDGLGASCVRVLGEIRAGMPQGVIEGGSADGVVVVTKAGGFGAQGDLSDVVRELSPAPFAHGAPSSRHDTVPSPPDIGETT